MSLSASTLVRWSGLAAVAAGMIFAGIQPIHPPDETASVTTSAWTTIQSLKTVMCLLFVAGITGLYARQANHVGWLGLVGWVFLVLSWSLQLPFVFMEAFVLPQLAASAPGYVDSFLAIVNGASGETDVGALPVIYTIVGFLYLLGGLVFGIATYRAKVLSRWGGVLLAAGAVLPLLLSSLIPHPFDRYFAVPVGLAIAWLGYSLWVDRRAAISGPATVPQAARLRQS